MTVRNLIFAPLLCLLIASSALSLPAHASVPQPLVAALKKYDVPASALSLQVTDVETGAVVYRHNAEQVRNPASVMKLVTTLAALDILGPAHTWTTRYYLDGPLKNGVLDGNLVIKGGGDPFLSLDAFLLQLLALQQRGVRTITGDLIIDNSRYQLPVHDPAAFDDEPYRLYNVGADAALLNFKASRFVIQPTDDRINVFVEPPLPYVKVVNNLKAQSGKCKGAKKGWSHTIKETKPQQFTVTFSGSYHTRCGETDLRRSFGTHSTYLHELFDVYWAQLGGSFSGGVTYGIVDDEQEAFYRASSKPLVQIISATNKYSNNVLASMLLLAVGDAAREQSESVADSEQLGREAIGQWLKQQKLGIKGLKLESGSGLARDIGIRAVDLDKLLRLAWRSPYRPEFLASLSVMALDGTTRKRLRKKVTKGRVRVKTGYIKKTRSIAGYVTAKSGKTYAVSMLLNHKNVHYWTGNALQDILLTDLLKR